MTDAQIAFPPALSPVRLLLFIAATALLALALAAIWQEYGRISPPHGLWDFGAFLASGRAAAQGLDPYGVYPPLTPHVVFPGFDAWNPNLNPPISALLFQALDRGSPEHSLQVWNIISLLSYAATVVLLLWRFARNVPAAIVLAAWSCALAGFWDTLYLGQIYLPLVLATVGAWLLLEHEQTVGAGILIGLVIAMKPNFLVWPVLLFLAGYRWSAIVSVITAAVISAVPLLVYGPEIYQQWLELLVSDGDRAAFLTNASLSGLAARAGISWLGTMSSAALLIGLAIWAFRKRPAALRASSFALLAAVLASPLGWIHYTLFLLPLMVWNWRAWPMWITAAILVVPAPYVIAQFGAAPWLQLGIGSAYNWALVVCLITLVMVERGMLPQPVRS